MFFYKLVDGIGVVYYVAVRKDCEGKGLGKTLVLSAEEVLNRESCRIFLASTQLSNEASRALFRSLGYEEFELDELYQRYGTSVDLLVESLCAYEDDLILVKGSSIENVLRSLLKNRTVVKRVWRDICYKPWIELWKS